jgi:DNA-directed RNA polymerase specialized sigma subunit
LDRYNPKHGCRLQAFLIGFVKNEILQYLRSERRRRAHEFFGGQQAMHRQRTSGLRINTILEDFAETLSIREQQFMEQYLLSRAKPATQKDLQTCAQSALKFHRKTL